MRSRARVIGVCVVSVVKLAVLIGIIFIVSAAKIVGSITISDRS